MRRRASPTRGHRAAAAELGSMPHGMARGRPRAAHRIRAGNSASPARLPERLSQQGALACGNLLQDGQGLRDSGKTPAVGRVPSGEGSLPRENHTQSREPLPRLLLSVSDTKGSGSLPSGGPVQEARQGPQRGPHLCPLTERHEPPLLAWGDALSAWHSRLARRNPRVWAPVKFTGTAGQAS